jgi:hypothetical protein
MRTAAPYLLGAIVLALVTLTGFAAQDPASGRKLPKQTHDTGVDDDDQVSPAQARRATRQRTVESVKVTVRPNGTIIAQLDESFEDALVVTRAPDGTWRYACLHGLPAAKHLLATRRRPSVPMAEEK